MSNRWTITQLEEIDDLTFAMCILSERREMLNQEAPLAKKLRRAFHTIEELRDAYRKVTHNSPNTISIKEAIHIAVERENTMDDIERHLKNDQPDTKGLTPEQVLADREIMEAIIEHFNRHGIGEEYWYALENAIEVGIESTLKHRSEEMV
jgi:hypothetical protein